MDSQSELYKDLKSIILTKDEIRAAVEKMGRVLTEDYRGKEPVFVCILKGAAMFFSDLIREIDLPILTEYVVLSSYQDGTSSSGRVKIIKDLDRSVEGRDVVVVEDIIDTGLTLSTLRQTLEIRGAASVKLVTLLDKPHHRKVDLSADYFCFTIPDAFVVGYGLDYAEKYRNLPDVGELHPRIYTK